MKSAAADPPNDQDDPRAVKRYRAGPFVFEKLKNGYRVRWSFSFGFGDR